MRWESQSVSADHDPRLPGFTEDVVVRRFDAPEALDTRFHEIRTKSAINRVPAPSRVPFEWTVNPYRGCSHACAYCLSGDTRVLMGDGTHRAIAELREGDEIYGTVVRGRCRRFARTRVLARWSSIKRAYRIRLADGTELMASADHRFLSTRGWKHVTGIESGATLRPHLTVGTSLVGVGMFADDPEQDEGHRLGFDHVLEPPQANGVRAVRIGGGIGERLSLHSTGPGKTREQDLEGRAIRTDADLRVVSVDPLPGVQRLYDITTGTGDFIANGIVSHNCFARPTHEYLDMDAGRDFEKEIVVKVNVPEVLRAELARPSWKREHVALGTNTDPYQWVEGRYKLMRGIWEAMRDFANPCSILTKSPLVLRDADLLCEIAERTQVSACLSVPTIDEKAWRATEPHTPSPLARLEAVAELNRLGIPTGILIAPLMPGINDAPEQVRRIVELATEAGAVHIGGQTLFLRGSVKDVFFAFLEDQRPDLLNRYRRLYASGAYLPADERRAIELRAGAPWARRPERERLRHRGTGRRLAPPQGAANGDGREVRQESLF